MSLSPVSSSLPYRPRNLHTIRAKIQDKLSFILLPQANGARVYPIPPLQRAQLKTKRMLEIEKEENQAIEVLIFRGDLDKLGRLYNVHPATVQVWRNLLHLYWSEVELPRCEDCSWRDRACHPHRLTEIRRCRILKMCERSDLVDVKDR